MRKSAIFFNVLRLPMDFLMLFGAGITTYFLRTKLLSGLRPVLFEFNLPLFKYSYFVFIVSFIFIASYTVSGLYSMRVRMGRAEEFLKILVSSSAAVMAIIIYIFLRQELFNSRFLVLGGWFLAIVFVFLGRLIVRYIQILLVSKYDFGTHKIMIIGNDDKTKSIIEEINNDKSSGYRIFKHLENPEVQEVKSAVGNPGIDEVILANPNYPADKIIQLIEFCHENHLTFKFVPNIYQTLTANFEIDIINALPLIELKRTALDGWGKVAKRVLDIIASVFGLIILSPVIVLIAFSVKWETEGPVFVRLERISKNKKFRLLKFRSMINNAHILNPYLRSLFNDRPESGPLWKMKNDPRVTPIGRFIRRTRLDEIPQLWNVLKGDISLVGPRPHQPDEIEKYQKEHKRVLAIKAGATGLAQISGSSDLPFEQEVTLDTFYMESWSLWLDLKIIFKTVFKLFTDRSAV